jgi:hypothetical protein
MRARGCAGEPGHRPNLAASVEIHFSGNPVFLAGAAAELLDAAAYLVGRVQEMIQGCAFLVVILSPVSSYHGIRTARGVEVALEQRACVGSPTPR